MLVQRLLVLLVLLSTSLPQAFVVCKPSCQMQTEVANSPAPNSCCSFRNDPVKGEDESCMPQGDCREVESSRDDCRQTNTAVPESLQAQQSFFLVPLSSFFEEMVSAVPGGGSPVPFALLKAMGVRPWLGIPAISSSFAPLRI